MFFLYGSRPEVSRKLVATFDSEEQLLAYVGWSKLRTLPDGTSTFEQGSALSRYDRWETSSVPLDNDDPNEVPFNPSPSRL